MATLEDDSDRHPVIIKLKEQLSRPIHEFETLSSTIDRSRAAAANSESSKLKFGTDVSSTHLLQDMVVLADIHDDLKGFAESTFCSVTEAGDKVEFAFDQLLEDLKKFTDDEPWESRGGPAKEGEGFTNLVTAFYDSQISAFSSSFASFVEQLGKEPISSQEFKLETIPYPDAIDNGSGVDAILRYTGPFMEQPLEPEGHILAAYHFRDTHLLTGGVWASMDRISGMASYPWADGEQRLPEVQRRSSRPDNIDVIQEMFSSVNRHISKMDVDEDSNTEYNGAPSPNHPNFPDHKTALIILQRAWALAVKHNTTFIVISNGNEERIGIRHRGLGILFLSDTRTISQPASEYLKSHVGFYLLSRAETEIRLKRERKGEWIDLLNYEHPNNTGLIDQRLSEVEKIHVQADENKRLWVRHSSDEHQKLCLPPLESRKFRILHAQNQLSSKTASISPPPRAKAIPSMAFFFQTSSVDSFFSHDGTLQPEGCQTTTKSNLVAKFAKGPKCKELCKYYNKYQELIKLEDLRLPRHYGLFQTSGLYLRDRVEMVLIAESPGSIVEEPEKLKDYQKGHLKDQLTTIHKAGLLHKGIADRSIHKNVDGKRVYLLGFENLERVKGNPEFIEKQKREEVKALWSILGDGEPPADLGLDLN